MLIKVNMMLHNTECRELELKVFSSCSVLHLKNLIKHEAKIGIQE
jgi:hypothetical protein